MGKTYGYTVTWVVRHQLFTVEAGFNIRAVHMEFVTEKVALGQIFSEYFSTPLPISLH